MPRARHELDKHTAWTAKWLECSRCRLCETRKSVVLGRGQVGADLLVIGEAPGEVEDEVGEPFRGPAGKLLDRGLTELKGLSYYITNVVACRPPDNRNPTATEAELCSERLRLTLRVICPYVVLLVGAQPLWHVLSVRGIEQNRGKVLAWKVGTIDIPVVATWHPAAILRSRDPQQMQQFRDDIRMAAGLAWQNLIPF